MAEKVLLFRWDEDKEKLEKLEAPEKETRFTYGDNDVILLVVVKDPGRVPRVMPVNIEDPGLFLSENFGETWRDIGDKVKAELSRIVVR